MAWKKGRGALGGLKPLLGRWASEPSGRADKASAAMCTRAFTAFGDKAVQLDARWAMGKGREYREIAFYRAGAKGKLGFASFTNDGKSSEGTQCDGRDIHPEAIAFEAKMPAGVARMAYWPTDDGEGFHFAVESKTKNGWKRFFLHTYRRAETAHKFFADRAAGGSAAGLPAMLRKAPDREPAPEDRLPRRKRS